MVWEWSQDTVIMSAMVFALLFAGVGLLVNTSKSCDTTNNFLVLNDANMSSQSLSQLYFDCLKYCGDKFSGSQGSKTECFSQCNKIGDFQSPVFSVGSVCGNLTYVPMPCDCHKDGCLVDCFRCEE